MGQIYRESHRYLIWLEDGETLGIDSDLGLQWELKVDEDVRKSLQRLDTNLMRSRKDPHRCEDDLLAIHIESENFFYGLLEHPWFKQVRVYQEFLLSTTFAIRHIAYTYRSS